LAVPVTAAAYPGRRQGAGSGRTSAGAFRNPGIGRRTLHAHRNHPARRRTLAARRALYKAIVRNLEPFDVPPQDVKIILIEVSAESVGMRGGLAACDLDVGYAIKV
jgi:hypothetical protein